MFARAFTAFIEDKIESQGRKSEFLSYGSKNVLYGWGGVDDVERLRPFPEGEERTRINAAFQDFFDTLKTETTPEGNTRLYSIKNVYTGSAADYDKPSLHFIGTGEGAQVYGWGLYGSSSEDVARWYAEKDAKHKTVYGEFEWNGNVYNRNEISEDFRIAVDYLRGNDPAGALKNIEKRIADAEEFKKKEIDSGQESILEEGFIERLKAIADIVRQTKSFRMLPDRRPPRNLYNQTFWPGKEENLLDWDKEVPESQMRQIIEMAEKEDHILTYVIPDNKKITGEEIYKLLSAYPRSPKAASEFLYRAGIDGITYVGDTSGVRNYAAFSDQDVQIDNHVQYSMKRGEAIWDNKKADELLLFRDLARGIRFDPRSIAAVRQSILNITSLDEKVKSQFIDFLDNWERKKPTRGMERPLDAKGFATAMGVLGFERDGSSSSYRTINGNTVRVSHHNASMGTFLQGNRSHDNVVSIVVEKGNQKKFFEADDRVDGVEYVFPASDLEAHPGKLGLIIHDIAQFFATGTYVDHAGAKYFHTSGTEGFRTDAQKRFDEEKKAREQAYDAVSKLRAGDEAESTENTGEDDENSHIQYSLVRDPKRLRRLKAEEARGEYITLYRAAQLRDGKLYPPMAGKINGEWQEPIVLGEWEQADEHPELIVQGNKFSLNKGNGTSVPARYNPYFHSSPTPLNDQFSTAYKRPELVTLEIRVPKSELTSGYHAELAKDPVGMMDWPAGVVQKKLTGTRQVMLSRWDKPIRIIPDSEVAQKIKKMLDGQQVQIPANVVTPSLRRELEKIGVPVTDGKEYSLKKRRQVNPIREPGPIRDEYQDRLDNSTYTPRSNAEVNRLAARRIANLGGMAEAARMVADGELTGTTDVGQRMMQLVLNSPEFKALDVDERDRIAERYIKAGTEASRALGARRLKALDLDDITSVQAHINALMAKLDKLNPKNTLRDDILKEFEVDIDALPDDIVTDPEKLDELVRKLAAQRANIWDKLYEFWINSILSGPTTHGANTLGNVSNAVYELGLKRFAEAAVNLAAFFQYSAKSPKVRSRGESFTGILSKVTTPLRPVFMMLSGIS